MIMNMLCFQPLDTSKFAEVRHVLKRNISKSGDSTQGIMVKPAPLATPEHIDIGTDYAIVKVNRQIMSWPSLTKFVNSDS